MKWTVTMPAGASASIIKKLAPLSAKAVKIALPKVAALVVDRVTAVANQTFKTQASVYLTALHSPAAIELTDKELKIRLITPEAQALEEGAESFDIKAKMLAHAKKFGKNGNPYIDVPFQHAVKKNAVHLSSSVPTEVHQALSSLASKAKAAGIKAGMTKEAASVLTVRHKQKTPGKSFDRKLRIGGKEVTTKVEHKRGIHDDMMRTATLGAKKVIPKYTTIRRISEKSATTSWWHPGFQGKHLFRQVMPTIEKQIQMIIRDAYAEVGLKVAFK